MEFFGKLYHVNNIEQLMLLAPKLKEQTYNSQMILIRGIPALSREVFLIFSRHLSDHNKDKDKFISWDFGEVMELKEDPNAKNYLFSKEAVPFHWDGAFHEEPGILVFNCIEGLAKETGRTLFANTKKIISSKSSVDIEFLHKQTIEYRTEKLAHYGGCINKKIINRHPHTGEYVLRLGEAVSTKLNPVTRNINDPRAIKLVEQLEMDLYSPDYCYAHDWQAGDLLLADNHALLHGRESIGSDQINPRHLRRIQIR